MNVLFFVIVAFTCAIIIHFIYWKFNIPEKQTASLLKIFFSVLLVAGASLWLQSFNAVLVLHFTIAYLPLVAAYIITYSALEADSPSLVIIDNIYRAGNQGIARQDFNALMNDELLVVPRLKDLCRDNLAYVENEKYLLTLQGRKFIKIFIFFRHLLNLQKGG